MEEGGCPWIGEPVHQAMELIEQRLPAEQRVQRRRVIVLGSKLDWAMVPPQAPFMPFHGMPAAISSGGGNMLTESLPIGETRPADERGGLTAFGLQAFRGQLSYHRTLHHRDRPR